MSAAQAQTRQCLPERRDSEICFSANEDWLAKLPVDEGAAVNFLSYQITHNPRDLLRHVQRIRMQCRRTDADAIYGAMLDLFIVLGTKGLPLRRRLLKRAGGLMRGDQRKVLIAGLRRGIRATYPVPPSVHSRLSAGLSGTVQLVEQRQASCGRQTLDPVIEARELLDCGQIDTARRLLEQSLQQAPQRAELSRELLAIYRHTRNHRDFQRLYTQRLDLPMAARDAWEALSRQFAQWQTEESAGDD